MSGGVWDTEETPRGETDTGDVDDDGETWAEARTGRRPEGDGDRGRRRPEAGTRAADLDGVDRQTTRDGRDLGDRGRRQRGELDKPEADQRKGEIWTEPRERREGRQDATREAQRGRLGAL